MKDIRVVIIEDDLFARNWAAMLLARDWRTTLAGEVNAKTELLPFVKTLPGKVDLFLLDVDHIGERPGASKDLQTLADSLQRGSRVLLTGIRPLEGIIQQTRHERICGYILKDEINYSLTWAVSMAMEGHWITTPGVEETAAGMNFRLPPNRLEIDGRALPHNFTDHEEDIARLALLFSMERRDLADEKKITEDWSYGLVSGIYKKLGLVELLNGEITPEEVLGNNPLALEHVKRIIDQLKAGKHKARDMETLAFHILTMPEMHLCP